MTDMVRPSTCPISGDPAKSDPTTEVDYSEFQCPRCGRFRISRTVMQKLADNKYPVAERVQWLETARRNATRDGVPLIAAVDVKRPD